MILRSMEFAKKKGKLPRPVPVLAGGVKKVKKRSGKKHVDETQLTAEERERRRIQRELRVGGHI